MNANNLFWLIPQPHHWCPFLMALTTVTENLCSSPRHTSQSKSVLQDSICFNRSFCYCAILSFCCILLHFLVEVEHLAGCNLVAQGGKYMLLLVLPLTNTIYIELFHRVTACFDQLIKVGSSLFLQKHCPMVYPLCMPPAVLDPFTSKFSMMFGSGIDHHSKILSQNLQCN